MNNENASAINELYVTRSLIFNETKQVRYMCNKDARMLLRVIKFRAIQLSISGDLTKNFERHNFGRDDFRAT